MSTIEVPWVPLLLWAATVAVSSYFVGRWRGYGQGWNDGKAHARRSSL